MKWIYRAYIILGLWIFAAPWVLGYSSVTGALWSNIISGVLILLLAIWAIVGGSDTENPDIIQ